MDDALCSCALVVWCGDGERSAGFTKLIKLDVLFFRGEVANFLAVSVPVAISAWLLALVFSR